MIFIPELHLSVSSHVSYGDISLVQVYKEIPTLLELRTISRFVSRYKIPFYTERGEWTCDFVDFNFSFEIEMETMEDYLNVRYISNPTRLIKYKGSWLATGGVQRFVLLPPNGWIIPDKDNNLYDIQTGLPLRTTCNMEESSASGYAYFWRGEYGQGLLVVNRECERLHGDSFEISIVQSPDFFHENIGARKILRF